MVSVIIPTYNRKDTIIRAIESVLNQKYKDTEVIIIDDGSVDNTEDIIKSLYNYLLKKDKIRYIRIKHSGVSKARNTGIKNARGEWIAFLDSDDEWLPDKLQKQMQYLDSSNYLICHTDEIWIKDGKRINQGKKHKKFEGWFFIPSLRMCLISPSSVVIHKDVFKNVGYFDESFKVVEDYELWLRITSRYPVGFLSEKLTVKYGGHSDQLSKNIDGIERYRMLAIEKFIVENSNNKNISNFLKAAFEEYKRKALIYINGCKKREKYSEINDIVIKQRKLEEVLSPLVA